jgi:hypothetical protein
MRRPLNLVWPRQTLEVILEGYFIKEVLLSEIGRPIRSIVVEANAPFPFLNDALVVSFSNHLSGYLKEARSRGFINLGLLHMADEHGVHDRSFYASADYVFRHYWHEQALVPPPNSLGVMWIPNGYRTGVGPIAPQTMPTTVDRRIMGFFSGVVRGRTLSDERQQMVGAIQAGKLPFLVNETSGFGQGLGPMAYAGYLSMTRFGLAPAGNSPETIRLYEVLEAGAIPVALKSPFLATSDALGNPPFVLLNNWSELPAFYAPYANATDPKVLDEIEGRRYDVYNWWKAFKALQQRRVKELIDRSFARAYGE